MSCCLSLTYFPGYDSKGIIQMCRKCLSGNNTCTDVPPRIEILFSKNETRLVNY